MIYFLTFGFFIGYLVFLGALVWIFIHRHLAPRIHASPGEALVIYYLTVILALFLLILVNYYTGFLAEIYHFFDDALFDSRYTRSRP